MFFYCRDYIISRYITLYQDMCYITFSLCLCFLCQIHYIFGLSISPFHHLHVHQTNWTLPRRQTDNPSINSTTHLLILPTREVYRHYVEIAWTKLLQMLHSDVSCQDDLTPCTIKQLDCKVWHYSTQVSFYFYDNGWRNFVGIGIKYNFSLHWLPLQCVTRFCASFSGWKSMPHLLSRH